MAGQSLPKILPNMKYTFFHPYGNDKDMRILDAFQNDRSLPDVSYIVIGHIPGEWWDRL